MLHALLVLSITTVGAGLLGIETCLGRGIVTGLSLTVVFGWFKLMVYALEALLLHYGLWYSHWVTIPKPCSWSMAGKTYSSSLQLSPQPLLLYWGWCWWHPSEIPFQEKQLTKRLDSSGCFRIMLAKAKEQDLSLFFTSACCFGCLHKKWLKLQRRSPSGGGDNQTANSGTFVVRRLSLGTGLGKKTSLAAHGLTQSSPHPPGINKWKNDQTFSPHPYNPQSPLWGENSQLLGEEKKKRWNRKI